MIVVRMITTAAVGMMTMAVPVVTGMTITITAAPAAMTMDMTEI